MTWPTKTDFVDGDVLTAAQVNNVGTNLNLYDPTSATLGQVPIADGAGSVAFGAISAGWTELGSQALSGLSTHTFSTISQDYDTLYLWIENVTQSTGAGITIRPNNITGYCAIIRFLANAGNTTGSDQTTIATNYQLYDDSFILIRFDKYAALSVAKPVFMLNKENTDDGNGRGTINMGAFFGNNYDGAAISSIRFFPNAGTFTAGTAYLYGA